jgi:uncharacterized protein YlxW (UPF0749 family)
MAHTHSQDLEAHLNTLSSDFSMAQKELRQLNANISTINSSMNSTIDSKMEALKQDMEIQLESFVSQLLAGSTHLSPTVCGRYHAYGSTNSQGSQSPSISSPRF